MNHDPEENDPAPPQAQDEAGEAALEEDEPSVKSRLRRVRLVRKPPKKRVRLVRRREPAEEDVSDAFEESGLKDDFVSDAEHEGVRRIAKSVVDAVVPDLVRKIVHAGGEALQEDALRKMVSEVPMPKEVAGFVAHQASGVRGEFQRVLTREVQKFLETVDISGEIQSILTSMTFEIKTEIRFVPNEKKVKPRVKNRVRVKRDKEKQQKESKKESEKEPEIE